MNQVGIIKWVVDYSVLARIGIKRVFFEVVSGNLHTISQLGDPHFKVEVAVPMGYPSIATKNILSHLIDPLVNSIPVTKVLFQIYCPDKQNYSL